MEALMFWQSQTEGLDFLAKDSSTTPSSSVEHSGASGGILRALGFMENGVATAHTYGSSNIVYALRMHSTQPLQKEHVETALLLIQRRIQNLRLCIREVYGRRFFAEMQKSRILFQERHRDDWMTEYEAQLQAIFDVEQGPLWSAVLLTMPETNAAVEKRPNETDESVLLQDDVATAEHKYLSMLVLTFCHAISDGASNAVFCNTLLSTLNHLIEGDAIPEQEHIPLQVSLEDMQLVGGKRLTLTQIAATVGQLWSLAFPPVNQYLACFSTRSLPQQTRMRTYSLLLSQEETSRLVRTCRCHQVSVHAAFTVAASVALFRIVARHRIAANQSQLPLLNVRSGHVVNFRRYLQPVNRSAYGCYMGFFEANVDVNGDSDCPTEFWRLVRTAVAQMKQKLEQEQQPVTYCQLMQKFLSTERWVHRQHTKQMPHVSHYFGTSNMGDLDRIFDATGQHVEVTQLVRTTNIGHDLGMVYAHMFHTLRGRLMYNLDYLVSVVTEDQAKEYADETLLVLKTMSV